MAVVCGRFNCVPSVAKNSRSASLRMPWQAK